MNKIYILLWSLSLSLCALAQSIQKGPYTVSVLTDGVYHIEDANDSNPAGMHMDEDGKMVGMNNCSDMYLVVGEKKALLIDLSNAIKWDSTATESLRSIVNDRVDKRDLFITITHRHGDHMGMLPAFLDDSKANFWIPEAEFTGMDIFSKERTTNFAENASFDLGGGFVINTIEVPGHTEHSTLFFLKDKDLVFTGDAIGSGSGVWLFNNESFFTYSKAIDNLIEYIDNPANKIDTEKLVIHGGHAWQRGKLEKLTAQYIYDMQTLIERMGLGIAETEEMSSFISFLDTNFKFGTATITWNKEAAVRYADSVRAGSGVFTLIAEPQDYGLSVTRLIIDLGQGSVITGKDLHESSFEVLGSNMSDKGIRTITGLSVVDKNGEAIESGRYVAIDLDYGYDYEHSSKEMGLLTRTGKNGSRIAESENAYFYIVTLNKDLGKYTKGSKFIQQGDAVKRYIDELEKVTSFFDAKSQGGFAGFDYRFWTPGSVKDGDTATSALYVWVDSDALRGIYKYGTSFAITPEIQDHFEGGAYVLLPCHNTDYTGLASSIYDYRPVYKVFAKDIILLINKLLDENPAIDSARVVIGGCSFGSGVTLEALIQSPHLFAAGFPVSGGFSLTSEEVDILKEKPMWFVTANNDIGNKGNVAAYEQLYAVNAPVLNTVNEFVVLNDDQYYHSHWSWVMVHRNNVFTKVADRTLNLFKWLAAQRTDFIGKGPTHKGNNMDLIKLYDSYTFKSIDENVGDMEYYLYDPVAHGADPDREYPLIVVFHGAGNGINGIMCVAYTDCAVYGGEEYQDMLGGAYILFPKANEYTEEINGMQRNMDTWMTPDPNTGTSKYIPSAAAIIEKVIQEHKIDRNRVIVGGTSAGGYMTWRFMAVRPDLVKAAFLMAPANNPSDEELNIYEDMNIPIWVIHGKKDELCRFDRFTGPLMEKYKSMENVRVSALETVRYGDRGIVKLKIGVEMGQHLALFCVGANMIYDDGTAYDVRYPEGFIGWLRSVWK